MHRITLRLLIALLILILIGSFVFYEALRRQEKAADLSSMQGVTVCATGRDFSGVPRRCPDKPQYITNCAEATKAVDALEGIRMRSEINQIIPSTTTAPVECELKTVSQADGLYAIVLHAYYPSSNERGISQALATNGVRTQALNQLYSTYANLYQSYLALDLSTAPLTQGISSTTSLYQAFTPAFLVKGEPGFRMTVQVVDENGTTKPGAGTLIKVSCGDASDIMVTEPGGNSWFSFAGYERLRCDNVPLHAEVQVQKDSDGRWISDTPSYSYLYEPASATELTFQNRPQPAQISFTGKWQGIGVEVNVASQDASGGTHTYTVEKMEVSFACKDTGGSLDRVTNSAGRASISLADAQNAFSDCEKENFTVQLTDYDPKKGAPAGHPAYDYYFGSSGPVAAGSMSGNTLTGGSLTGQELEVGGALSLNSVGSIPGGRLTLGNKVCFFYTLEAAKSTTGCPDGRDNKHVTVTSDGNGYYLFGGSKDARLSYGDYVASGSGKTEVRVLTYKGNAFPSNIIDGNQTNLSLTSLTPRDIHLPTSTNDLKDYTCQGVMAIWNNSKECEPLFNIIFRESGWNVAATNPSSGACGLFQSNPCEKYQGTALPGENYKAISNQIRWGIRYIKARYDTPTKAWAFWQAHKHY